MTRETVLLDERKNVVLEGGRRALAERREREKKPNRL